MSRIMTARLPAGLAKISTIRPVTSSAFYQKAVNLKIIGTNKKFHLTSNGDLANIHDPSKHLS